MTKLTYLGHLPAPWGAARLPIILPDGKPLSDAEPSGYMITSPSGSEALRRLDKKTYGWTSRKIATLEESHYQPEWLCAANARVIIAAPMMYAYLHAQASAGDAKALSLLTQIHKMPLD